MINQRLLELLIEAMKCKKFITDIESDVLKTWDDYNRKPFDREKAQSRILTNNMRYPDICVSIDTMPQSVSKPFIIMTEEDFKYTLFNQMVFLLPKVNQ